jgi:hypothetical protein
VPKLQYGFPDVGLCKPKHVGANVIILNVLTV